MHFETTTYTARWIFPIISPPIENGLFTVQGERIVAVEPAGTRSADVDLGSVALLPGFVNAHTHLDLSGARNLIPPTDALHFTDWLSQVIAYRRSRTSEQIANDIQIGLNEAMRYGTTIIGDIASAGTSWNALSQAPIRSIVFREMLGLSEQRAQQSIQDAEAWLHSTSDTANTRRGLSPHAPYSTSPTIVRWAESQNLPLAMHIAETPAELELLETGTGPFVEFLQRVRVWDEHDFPRSWEEIVPRRSSLWIHANHLPAEHNFPTHGSIVVYCPRTHAAFGHSPHPYREYLARGIRVCLGTDSLASNPDLNIFAEAELIHERDPSFSCELLLEMLTLWGAEALGFGETCGSLEVGKRADVVAVPLPNIISENPYHLLFSDVALKTPIRTLFQGVWRNFAT